MHIGHFEFQVLRIGIVEAVCGKATAKHTNQVEHAGHVLSAISVSRFPTLIARTSGAAHIEDRYSISIGSKKVDGTILPFGLSLEINYGLLPTYIFHMVYSTTNKVLEV